MSWVIVYISIFMSTSCQTMVISYTYIIIYVAILQLLIYLLFSYTTCELSGSEFHNIVMFCSVMSSELVHVKEVLALTRLAYQSDLLSIRIL